VLERTHQVNLMSRIYSQAYTVAVWLGPEAEGSALALNHLYDKDLFDQDVRNAIFALCHRPYWNRLWIIQELVLAKSIYVLCGSEYQSWESLEKLASNMEDKDCMGLFSQEPHLPDSPAHKIITFRSRWNTLDAKKKTLDSFIVTGRIDKAECTDPRDKVFGLLGLVDELGVKSMGITEADYGKSEGEIYCDILRFLKRNPGNLSMTPFWIAKPLAVMLQLTTKVDSRSDAFKLLYDFFYPRAGEVANEEEQLRLILEAFQEEGS
jgi:Heterokaryon incompatibility protein (HET)